MIGRYVRLYEVSDDGMTLWVVQYLDHNVSEVFEDRQKAINYFDHAERYEAAQARKGRR